EARAALAHSWVDFNISAVKPEGIDWSEFYKWHSLGQTKSGTSSNAIDLEQLERTAVLAESCGALLLRLFEAIAQSRQGGDPAQALQQFDAANPHVR
ncbi:MAG TPA: hypothetical protein VEH29_11300, partial [Acidimicrobiales bacterium]|nr:hypothetical protein [Acidimicrobiales bacterium]